MRRPSPRLMPLPRRTLASAAGRAGFTLVELMVVIVIIALLVGLLTPAVMGVRRRANVSQVRADIAAFETAISSFNKEFGMDPPSHVKFPENFANWDSADALQNETKSLFRQLWPNMRLSSGVAVDVNADGDTTDVIELQAGEALVFFLGGLAQRSTGTNGPVYKFVGFSKNPVYPFAAPSANENLATRQGPFFEFAQRFTDLNDNKMPEYVDPLPSQKTPYFYASSAGGRKYDATIYSNFATSGGKLPILPYQQDLEMKLPFKPKSYQIVSPGYDGVLGYGGPFLATESDPLPTYTVPSTTDQVTSRDNERDNITNFHNGTLGGI